MSYEATGKIATEGKNKIFNPLDLMFQDIVYLSQDLLANGFLSMDDAKLVQKIKEEAKTNPIPPTIKEMAKKLFAQIDEKKLKEINEELPKKVIDFFARVHGYQIKLNPDPKFEPDKITNALELTDPMEVRKLLGQQYMELKILREMCWAYAIASVESEISVVNIGVGHKDSVLVRLLNNAGFKMSEIKRD